MVAAALVAGLGVSGCDLHPNDNTLPGQVAVGGDGYTVTVYFDQIENLVANSTVQLDNVTIGTVAAIEVEDWQAKVTLRLKKSVPLPETARFSVAQKTLLGAQYVQVDRPRGSAVEAGRTLSDGDTVPVEQTGVYPVTEQVLASASLLLNNGGLSQISTITSELTDTFRGRVPDARGTVAKLNQLLAVLDRNKAQVVSILESLDRLSGQLVDDREVLGNAIDQITPGLRTLSQQRAALVRAVRSAGRLSSSATSLIGASQEDLLANLGALRPVLTQLARASGRLPEALKWMITLPFPVMTTPNAIKGDFSNLFATIDLSLPTLTRNWFAGGVLPSMQAGDPTTDPLTPIAPGPTSPTAGPDDEPSNGNDDVAPTVPTPGTDCGLLGSLLGGC
jgi:phospholipid/cholesterol/gamma-HCH transport system substrate-binding protein